MQSMARGNLRWVPTSTPSPSCHTLLPMRLMRRHATISCNATAAHDGAVHGSNKGRIVFLGTPDVAASVLKHLISASSHPDANFELVGVVAQPGKPKGRGNKATPIPTPVEEAARAWGQLPDDAVLCPASAKDPEFLERMRKLQPDLCVTAAYGNMLPQAFLDIPRHGTLNIHPSLLPKYRGAAPVQRALQDGVQETGVSVAYTVLKCDAGPVLAQEKVVPDPDIQAPELLQQLFDQGAAALLRVLPDVWAGQGPAKASPQDESAVVHAAKLSKEEAVLNAAGAASALALHNHVRGFAGWPGSVLKLLVVDDASGTSEPLELRVLRTSHPTEADISAYKAVGVKDAHEVTFAADGDMLVPCQGGAAGVLRVKQVQQPAKKAVAAKDFRNGMRSKRLLLQL